MGKEIERKFLVKDFSFTSMAERVLNIRQAYLCTSPDATVRIRVCDNLAFLTVKTRNRGAVRGEWEYPIPVADADDMICASGCRSIISKHRYIVPFAGHRWEVDEFGGHLQGLIVAEVELASEDETVELPSFVGREVTGDKRYYNSCLSDPSASVPPAD